MNTRWSAALRRYGLVVLLGFAANCEVWKEPIAQQNTAAQPTVQHGK
jgi:hypothetical protein